MELGRCFIHSLDLPWADPCCVLVESNEYLMGMWWGSCQRFCVLVVAMDTTVQVICWMNALVTCALESPVQILPTDELCGGWSGDHVLVPDGLPSPSVSQKQERARWLRGNGSPSWKSRVIFQNLHMEYLAWADVSSTGRQRIYKISLSCTEGNWCYKLVRTLQLPKRVVSGHWVWLLWSLTIKFVKSRRQRNSVALMSIFLNRRALPPQKRYPSWSLFADVKAGILDFSFW